jgi:sugar lactone lactonase YvrE
MKKVKIALLGLLLVGLISCKKAEKVEIEKPTTRIVSTVAGAGTADFVDGTGVNTLFNSPEKIISDASGNIYVADRSNNRIRKITPQGVVTTFAGNGNSGNADGQGTAAKFNQPFGITIDKEGNLYVTDAGNNSIRKITASGMVSTLAGGTGGGFADGTGSDARFNYPFAITIDASNNLLVCDLINNRIRKVTPSGVVTTFVGNGQSYFLDGPLSVATMYNPTSIAIDPTSGNIYVGQDCFIRKITPQGITSVLTGSTAQQGGNSYKDGPALVAGFYYIFDLAVDKKGNVYAADCDNHVIRKITPDGMVSTYAGIRYLNNTPSKYQDGLASDAYFARPSGITFDKDGNLLVSEQDNNRIRKITEVPFPDSPEEFNRKNWNKPTGWK